MRIRVVGRKSGVTDKDVGAAVSVAVGAIKAGRHKGVIKGKCLWLYNQYLDIATIKLMLSDSPSLVVKLDIDEYKYTDIEAVLSAAAKLYKDDTVSQFTSSAMYKNIKAISSARYISRIVEDPYIVANIFRAACEAVSAEAAIPQSAEFRIYTPAGDVTYEPEYEGMARTDVDPTFLRMSLTRFAWFTNSAISGADVTIIQDVYDSITHSLSEASFEDWTNTYKDAIGRVLTAIGNIKDTVPAYFAALQTQYTSVPTYNIGSSVQELHAAMAALPYDVDAGVSEDTLYGMYGVIAIATVVEACAEYINRGIETYKRIADAGGSISNLVSSPDPIDFTEAFGQDCPNKAIRTTMTVSTVCVDGSAAIRVHVVPTVEHIMRYVTDIEGSLNITSRIDAPVYRFSGTDGNLFEHSARAYIDTDYNIPCALLIDAMGARISEEMRVSGVTRSKEHGIFSRTDTFVYAPAPEGAYGELEYIGVTIEHTHEFSVKGSGTCDTAIRIPCNGIYAYGAGFPAATDIQWSSIKERDTSYKYDGVYTYAPSYNPQLGDYYIVSERTPTDMDVTDTADVSATPSYSEYPLLVGDIHIIDSVPIHTNGELTFTDVVSSDTSYIDRVYSTSTTTHNSATFNIATTVRGEQVGNTEITSGLNGTFSQYGVGNDNTAIRNDSASSQVQVSAWAEYDPGDVYKSLSVIYNKSDKDSWEWDDDGGWPERIDGAMPWYPDIEYITDSIRVFNTDYGVRYILGIDAQSIKHTASSTITAHGMKTGDFGTSYGGKIWSANYLHHEEIPGPGATHKAQDANASAKVDTHLGTRPMYTDGDNGPVTSTLSGKVTIIDGSGALIYSADIIDVISAAVYNGYAIRAVDYVQLFIPDSGPATGNITEPIVNPPSIPMPVGSGMRTIDRFDYYSMGPGVSYWLPFDAYWFYGGDYFEYSIYYYSSSYFEQHIIPRTLTILPTTDGGVCGTYTKTVTPPTYTVDNAPAPIRDYNKLLRCPEFLVLNSLMGGEYTDTSVTPPVTRHVPSFVPLDKAIQYMSMDGEGTPTPKLNVGQIQPMFISDQSMIDQVKDRVNAHIATKLQELSNTYLQDNPTAVVDEAVRKQLTPAAVKSAIEEQLFTPIRGILPAHTEVNTTAVKPVGTSAGSNTKPAGIEYVLSVVSRGIGTYVDLGVLA